MASLCSVILQLCSKCVFLIGCASLWIFRVPYRWRSLWAGQKASRGALPSGAGGVQNGLLSVGPACWYNSQQLSWSCRPHMACSLLRGHWTSASWPSCSVPLGLRASHDAVTQRLVATSRKRWRRAATQCHSFVATFMFWIKKLSMVKKIILSELKDRS